MRRAWAVEPRKPCTRTRTDALRPHLPRRPKNNSKPMSCCSVRAQALLPRRRLGDSNGDRYGELGRLFADVLERGYANLPRPEPPPRTAHRWSSPERRWACPEPSTSSTMATSPASCAAISSSIAIPTRFRRAMLDKHITRLVKSDNGDATFETISNVADVIKLAGRGGAFDLESEFGISSERVAPSTGSRNWRSPPASTPCATPASRWSCAIRPPPKARNCPIAGDCPTPCATIPA